VEVHAVISTYDAPTPMVPCLIFTDPACPYSWAAEPALRRLQVEFGAGLRFTYVMAGLAREFTRPVETMRHWIDASALAGMPCDPRLWLDGSPTSSYPACIAVKAAAEQGLGAHAPTARRAARSGEPDRTSTGDMDGAAPGIRCAAHDQGGA